MALGEIIVRKKGRDALLTVIFDGLKPFHAIIPEETRIEEGVWSTKLEWDDFTKED